MMGSGEYDGFKPGMALDVYHLLPEDYMNHLSGGNCEIFYFITFGRLGDELLEGCRLL